MTSSSVQSISQSRQSAIDPCALSATELAGAIAQGTVTAREAVEAHIARIERVNGALNAVVVKRYDDARAEANAIDRRRAAGETLPPLAGVPITVKECLDLVGTPSTFGIPARAAAKTMSDNSYVARLRAAGAIVVAKTNVSQLLIFTEADNPVYGRTNNPWWNDLAAARQAGRARSSPPAAPRWGSAPISAAACASPQCSAEYPRCVRPRAAAPIPAAPVCRPASARS
jgi:fatty acid amide hydrolase